MEESHFKPTETQMEDEEEDYMTFLSLFGLAPDPDAVDSRWQLPELLLPPRFSIPPLPFFLSLRDGSRRLWQTHMELGGNA